MITNLASFKMDLTRFYQVAVPKNHLQLQMRIAVRLFQLITVRNSQMKGHPVDTGWARANWGVSLGVPGTGTRGSKTSLPPPINLASVLAGAKPFGIIWIFNNVPYIVRLENGHSKKAPEGMVEGALTDLQVFVNKL